MKSFSPAQRQFLKGLAHTRQPVVMIGNQGLTAAVLKEVDHALNAHELIKIKTASDAPDTRRAWLEPKDVINTWTPKKLTDWLKKRG